jgi:hypothetical protein
MLLPLPEEGREGGKAGKEGVLFNPPGAVEPVVAEPKPPALPAGWSAAAVVPERGGRVEGTLANRLPAVEPALLGWGGARVTGGKANGAGAGVDEEEEEEEEEAAENRLEAGAVWAAGAPKAPKEGAVEVAAPPAVPGPPNVKEGVEGAVIVVVLLAASSLPPLAELSAAAVDEEGSPPKVKDGS